MKRTLLTFAAALATTLAANAIEINSAFLIGHVIPGSPSGDALEEERLEYIIDAHNGDPLTPISAGTTPLLDNAPLPPLPAYDGTSTGALGGGVTTFSLDVTGWNYLLVKWANDSYYYYVGGLTGTHTVKNDVVFNTGNGKAQNASHYRLFGGTPTNTPDAGSTLTLLGSLLAVAGGWNLLRRKA